jgi:hypothetical protein
MATTAKIVSVLKKAGKTAQRYEKGRRVQDGYTMSQWNKGLVGITVNTSDEQEIESFKKAITEAGYTIFKPENVSAIDGFFVR